MYVKLRPQEAEAYVSGCSEATESRNDGPKKRRSLVCCSGFVCKSNGERTVIFLADDFYSAAGVCSNIRGCCLVVGAADGTLI